MLQRQHLLASATLALVFAGISTGTAAARSAPATRAAAHLDMADRAIAYLHTQQHPDGSLDGSAGETEDLVLGAVAAGIAPATLRSSTGHSPLDFLAAQSTAGASAGAIAKLALAASAAGHSPTHFGGRNLITQLAAQFHGASGAYGDGSTFGQSLAILALRGAHRTVPAAAIRWLSALQNSDGSWNFGNAAGPEGDTNSTAVAVQALLAAATPTPVAAALAYLHGQQNPDGGFPYQAPSPFGTPSDPDSDSLVLAALAAAGQHNAAWSVGGHTPLSNLRTFQARSGGFIFPGNTAPDTFTTSQVPQGAEQAPLPLTGWVDTR